MSSQMWGIQTKNNGVGKKKSLAVIKAFSAFPFHLKLKSFEKLIPPNNFDTLYDLRCTCKFTLFYMHFHEHKFSPINARGGEIPM
jgi:hypothetical protein